jgi:ketosteroid isomerase-like protein
MRASFLLLIMVATASCNTSPETGANDMITESDVRAFIAQYDRAWNAKDSAMVKTLLSDDYLYFTSQGGTNNKPKTLAFLRDTAYVIHAASRPELEIIIHGNVATVNSHWTGELSWNGEAIHDNQRCGITLAKVDGKTEIISEHCIEIKQQ